jgi:hypothetical protein
MDSSLRKQAKKELRQLKAVQFKTLLLVDRLLGEDFGIHLYVKDKDKPRLLTLKVWSQKYHIPIRYILRILVPYYRERRWKTRAPKEGKRLGVTIPTLVGKHSELILKQQLLRDFPAGEHHQTWKWTQIRKLLVRREGVDEFAPKVKSLMDFQSVREFVSQYRKKSLRHRKEWDKECQTKENRRRPYRGNPFRM